MRDNSWRKFLNRVLNPGSESRFAHALYVRHEKAKKNQGVITDPKEAANVIWGNFGGPPQREDDGGSKGW
jgi:hypothetical protein